jgi:NADH-quinone oxidoreductase subunit F
MIVGDEDTCMVDLARFFISFTQAESCGKCLPCREGGREMLSVLERITNGEGKEGDIEYMEWLADLMKSGSLCALGQTSPNPVLTTIKYFREEYEEHIKLGYCRAGVCAGLVKSPCQNTCPAGIDVPRYIRALADGKYGEATAVIREKVPFPAVLGYVCVHYCESKCRRGQLDEAIAIKELKRFAAENDDGTWKKNLKKAEPTGKKAAIIGSGPAGLTAAYYLARRGHEVTVFESLPVAGGMMRVGIPNYRLPAEVLDKEIKEIEDIGVTIKTNSPVESLPVAGGMMRVGIPNYRLPAEVLDKEIKEIEDIGVTIKTNSPVESIDDLKKQGYDAVFVSVGAHKGTRMGIEGEDLPGVVDGVDILRDINLGNKVEVGKKVMVIGGGNVAMDAARTAVRLGADVTVVYRRTRNEMPASDEEIDEALEEGVKIEYLTNPTGIEKTGNGLKITLVRMQLGKVDESGRRRPEPIEGSEYTREFDTVIKALGQESVIPEKFGVETARGGRIVADKYTLATSVEGVYAGGDVTRGPASVIEAIADGRQAAVSMDLYLGGTGLIDEELVPPEAELPPLDPDEIESDKYRPELKLLPVEERIKSYAKVLLGFDAKCVKDETKRCLQCDLEER